MNSTARLDYSGVAVVTIDEVRTLAMTLPRTTEALVRGRVKFRVGRIVYLAFSRDETLMGFAFPKEWRDALVESEPDKFMLPRAIGPPIQLGGRPARGDRRRGAARARHRCVGDGRAEESLGALRGAQLTVLELDTPHGQANAHLHPAADARAALVLGHGAAGGVTARGPRCGHQRCALRRESASRSSNSPTESPGDARRLRHASSTRLGRRSSNSCSRASCAGCR